MKTHKADHISCFDDVVPEIIIKIKFIFLRRPQKFTIIKTKTF